MTDKELSNKLMDLMYPEAKHWCLSNCETFVYDCGPIGEQYYKLKIIDINDWSDIMPIAVSLGVCLNNPNETGYHEALTFDDHGYVKLSISDKSPQRALAICCIKALSK